MEKVLAIFSFLLGIGVIVFAFPDGPTALLVCLVFALAIFLIINKYADGEEEKEFLRKIFLVGLLLRILLSTIIYVFELQNFFGGDAFSYHEFGYGLMQLWFGETDLETSIIRKVSATSGPGWGMYYLVATLYTFTGKNLLAGQLFSATIGAGTIPAIYFCSQKLFKNQRVAKYSAIITAVFPSLILWSSQLLKDGYIIFFLVMIMVAVLALQEKFSYLAVTVLILSLFGILSIRFYIFYMVSLAALGSFVIGLKATPLAILRRSIAVALIGLALTFMGVSQTATIELETFANLERVEQSRRDLAQSADSGYGKDQNVSTIGGAIAALPIGFTYLMFAPFPWQLGSFRQAITLPEMLVWWASIPFLLIGLLYTIRNRLRGSLAILIFTLMLTLAYSVFQGNVGTAYRQRAQIQVFHFIFIAVGLTVWKEKKENNKLLQIAKQQEFKKNFLRK